VKPIRRLLAPLFLMLMTLAAGLPSRADDIDLYSNAQANTLRAPYTVIVLDLNLLGICNSVLTQTSNPNNPDAPQLCLNISNNIVLGDLLAGITSNPTQLLTDLLVGTSGTDAGRAQALCNLYGLLGINSPVVQLPVLGLVLRLLLGGVSTLTCGTLNFLLGIPLLSAILNPLLTGFVGQLVSGLISPLLTSVVGQLPSAAIGLLNTTFSGVLNLGQVSLLSLLEAILTNLINTNVAIMVSHADRATATGAPGSACSFSDTASIPGARRTTAGCSNGAYMLVGFTPLLNQGSVTSLVGRVGSLLTNTLNPTNLLNSITAILSTAVTTPTQLLPPYQGKEAYAELIQYLGGRDVYNAPLARWDGLTGLLTRDTTIELASGLYSKPALECRTANVLNVMLTNNIRDGESDALLRSRLSGLPASGAITLGDVVRQTSAPNAFKDRDNNDINLRSFFLLQNLLTSTATLANTGATVLSYVDSLGLLGLGQSLAPLLKPTLVTDASLVTPRVASSPQSSTGLLEPAYFAQFRPRDGGSPNWDGNIKVLRFARDSAGVQRYLDNAGNNGIASDGRIASTALTIGTRGGALGGAGVDGRTTTLGGVGQNIPGYRVGGGGNPGRINSDGARQIFYDALNGSNVPSLAALDADSQTVRDALRTDLGVTGSTASDDTLRRALLLHARGFNVGTSTAPVGTGASLTGVTGRPWLLGAVLHSQPVAVNYGARSGYSSSNPDIRLLFGSADGLLHSVKNSDLSETWAFMPRATMASLKTLRDDRYAQAFPYGVDGAPSVLIIDRGTSTTLAEGGPADGVIDSNNPNDRAYAFFGLRRGGKHRYALDITDPDRPRLIWRIGPDGLYSANASVPGLVTGSAAQFAELALSFGTPTVGRLRYSTAPNTNVTRPVLLFGGGYNGGVAANGSRIGKDANNSLAATAAAAVGVDDSVGNALYIVDAVTGELIWKANRSTTTAIVGYDSSTRLFRHPLLADSIASDLTVLDTDGDGLSDRLYVGDTGGRIWRADFPGTDRSAWTLGPIANLGRGHPVGSAAADASNANDRRFFHAPDYVPGRDASGSFDAVVVGSGDREDPFNRTTGNWLYTIRDRDTTSGKTLTDTGVNGVIASPSDTRLIQQSTLADISSACATVSNAACSTGAAASSGWRLQLANSGEKAVSAPVTVGNVVNLSSFVPPAVGGNSCVPDEGSSRLYGVRLLDGRPAVQQYISDGDSDLRSRRAAAPGIAGEASALTPQLTTINAETLGATVPLIYRTFWRERREDEEKPVAQ